MLKVGIFLFGALGLMFLVWLLCVRRLSHRLRDRHPEKYDDMGLADLWPSDLAAWVSGHNNSRPVWALLGFLFSREDLPLRDARLSSLVTFMRWLFLAYLGLFVVIVYLAMQEPGPASRRAASAAAAASSREEPREQAYRLHREHKFAEAIPVYDRLLTDSSRDAELTYWRGIAHWQLGNLYQALQDFRRAVELDPMNLEAHRGADRILSGQQRWDEVIELWSAYLRSKHADPEAYLERARASFHRGDLDGARADAAKACGMGMARACARARSLEGGK